MDISALHMDFKTLNERIKSAETDVTVTQCYGQRFIGCGARDRKITVSGTPGNALGAYLDGAVIEVRGNAQDAVGDTMNDGRIIIHGAAGDALGYAMRGGAIFVKNHAGYRTGIHMKEYKEKKPVIVIGGKVGSFLGEYLAGGLIIVLGIGADGAPVGHFTGTGMHGGVIFIRSRAELTRGVPVFAGLPDHVTAETASEADIQGIAPYIKEYAGYFNRDAEALTGDRFIKLSPNVKNPYKQFYTAN